MKYLILDSFHPWWYSSEFQERGLKAISLRIDGRFGSREWWSIFGLTLPPKSAKDKMKNKTNDAPFTIHNEMALLCSNAKTLPTLIWTFKIGFYSNFYYFYFIFVKLSNEVLYFRVKLSFVFWIRNLCIPYAGPFHISRRTLDFRH